MILKMYYKSNVIHFSCIKIFLIFDTHTIKYVSEVQCDTFLIHVSTYFWFLLYHKSKLIHFWYVYQKKIDTFLILSKKNWYFFDTRISKLYQKFNLIHFWYVSKKKIQRPICHTLLIIFDTDIFDTVLIVSKLYQISARVSKVTLLTVH